MIAISVTMALCPGAMVLPNYEITLLDELSQRDCMEEGTNALKLVLFPFITMTSHFCSTGTARRFPG